MERGRPEEPVLGSAGRFDREHGYLPIPDRPICASTQALVQRRIDPASLAQSLPAIDSEMPGSPVNPPFAPPMEADRATVVSSPAELSPPGQKLNVITFTHSGVGAFTMEIPAMVVRSVFH